MRWGGIFIAGCITVSAGALGAAAYLAFGLTPGQAGASMIAAFGALAAIGLAARRKPKPHVDPTPRQVAELSKGTTDLARQVGELGRRLIALETASAKQEERFAALAEKKAQAEVAQFASEIEVLGTLVKQLADTVAAHEVTLLGSFGRQHAEPTTRPATPVLVQPLSMPQQPSGTRSADPEMLRKVRAALEANRIDLYLQPIVTLPQRKVRYYEAVTRLRTDDGGLLLPADFLAPAESGGLMPMLDNLMLFRCVQVVRRMSGKNRELGLFCNIATATLIDVEFFPQFQEFLAENRPLASALVFEFPQEAIRSMGPVERGGLAQLASLGFRFSMDRVTDLQFDARALAEDGFRYVKVPAPILLDAKAASASTIHAADLSNLLSRHGIGLIAERIETESTVVDLLDFDVRFGQGFLFAPPKPVRSEVFQSGETVKDSGASGAAASSGAPGNAAAPHTAAEQERITAGLLQLARNVRRA